MAELSQMSHAHAMEKEERREFPSLLRVRMGLLRHLREAMAGVNDSNPPFARSQKRLL